MSDIVSLFSGCGGLDIGFKMANHKIIWANENDREVCDVYNQNLKEDIICNDIQNISIKDIPDCDILIGGPPCQAFSMIGKRRTDDKNFKLIWDFVKILEKKKPKNFLIENVVGLKSATDELGNNVVELLKKKISKLGYSVNSGVLNAADFGVPQRRRRFFLLGKLGNEKIELPLPTHSEFPKNDKIIKWVTVKDAIGDLPKPKNVDSMKYTKKPFTEYQKWARKNSKHIQNHQIPTLSELDKKIISYVTEGGNYMDVPDSIPSTRIQKYKKTGGRTTTYGRLDRKKPAYTINTYFSRLNVGCNIHYSQDRLISIREGLRLQSFPDTFVIPSKLTKRAKYKIVGNAVPPKLSFALSKSFEN